MQTRVGIVLGIASCALGLSVGLGACGSKKAVKTQLSDFHGYWSSGMEKRKYSETIEIMQVKDDDIVIVHLLTVNSQNLYSNISIESAIAKIVQEGDKFYMKLNEKNSKEKDIKIEATLKPDSQEMVLEEQRSESEKYTATLKKMSTEEALHKISSLKQTIEANIKTLKEKEEAEAPKQEEPKQDVPKQDEPKQDVKEAPKVVEKKPEPAKLEAPKQDAPKQDAKEEQPAIENPPVPAELPSGDLPAKLKDEVPPKS